MLDAGLLDELTDRVDAGGLALTGDGGLPAHIAVGVDLDGVKHVLGIWVQAAEGAKFWAGV